MSKKIVVVNAGPRKGWNTDTLLTEAAKGAEDAGAEVQRFDLSRFKKAQKGDYEVALSEIKGGRKRSHWIWYIFPQLKGLGFSPMSEYYGLDGLEEAEEYLADPLLKARLLEISGALLDLKQSDPGTVMGYPDDLKLKSSMTLFAAADPEEPVFRAVLEKFFGGERDENTLRLLNR